MGVSNTVILVFSVLSFATGLLVLLCISTLEPDYVWIQTNQDGRRRKRSMFFRKKDPSIEYLGNNVTGLREVEQGQDQLPNEEQFRQSSSKVGLHSFIVEGSSKSNTKKSEEIQPRQSEGPKAKDKIKNPELHTSQLNMPAKEMSGSFGDISIIPDEVGQNETNMVQTNADKSDT
ncbi:hypothetical protein KGF54_003064 [Candida jiufengensis]|uniref:uncharacterized protein n=1 Tax=Candida jiufengensis TaxID=497108 RepID=UPI002224582D|nr:uncharacterized protein KGF54_003064 [Candida jiufengensis]KAI5953692.1 hypothetical protein KGF54_003064 [Candida jiufengensis]